MTAQTLRIAAVGDLHCSKATPQGALQDLFSRAALEADVLLLCGDLTDYGLPEEARMLIEEMKAAERVPIIAVLGNHDYESGQALEIAEILRRAGVHMLDGEGLELHGVGFAGVKGYMGGFGRRSLQAWGESSLKMIVHEAAEEALKLERALARLRCEKRIALLHYSPIKETVEGESPEILPFLGSSRLEEPLNRYQVTAVFHGHAHYGRAEGRTSSGVPVYNVAMSLMKRGNSDGRPFRVLEVAL